MRELTDKEKQVLESHKKWLCGDKGGIRANLCGADLRGADLDYGCWPLWCGSLDVTIDKRIFAQLAYHLCRTVCDDPEAQEAQRSLRRIANQFHRVDECGRIGDDVDA